VVQQSIADLFRSFFRNTDMMLPLWRRGVRDCPT
jgi:hypothetical protein